ncbi:hypothetical protein VNO77_28539 [Canavalia gladiata]|uniref:Serine/arginine repetitive matrix protein 1-like n=1 Tax=Canavalia gladiata TaxID=3824 RepID=A0AAN9KWV2_CANGL
MGCCISIPNQDPNGPKKQQPELKSHEANCRIPPLVEEESVKEVLSETPISKPQQVPILMPLTKTQLPVIQHRKAPIKKALELEEVSFVSETCSNNESFSTTTTVTENREDEATSKRSNREGTRNQKRSYTVDGNRIGRRERRPISPAKKPEIPPEKKMPAGSRSVRKREANQARGDSGEGSVRRSRSPSCAGTSGAGAGRTQPRPPGASGRRLPRGKVVGEENGGVRLEESLENPHVSLECFIFLNGNGPPRNWASSLLYGGWGIQNRRQRLLLFLGVCVDCLLLYASVCCDMPLRVGSPLHLGLSPKNLDKREAQKGPNLNQGGQNTFTTTDARLSSTPGPK